MYTYYIYDMLTRNGIYISSNICTYILILVNISFTRNLALPFPSPPAENQRANTFLVSSFLPSLSHLFLFIFTSQVHIWQLQPSLSLLLYLLLSTLSTVPVAPCRTSFYFFPGFLAIFIF